MKVFADILIGLRFFSRLPVPVTRREIATGAGGLAAAAAMVPVAGLIVGLAPATAWLAATGLRLQPPIAAALTVATAVLVTGALHEDALADCADGFGGGATSERKLAIMRDSRIGAYGACAIGLSLILRIATLAAVGAQGTALAATVILATAAISRTACLAPLVVLPPARVDGSGASAAGIAARSFAAAVVIAAVIGLLPVIAGASFSRCVASLVLAALATLLVALVAKHQIGGQTGDVAGAAQQLAEVAVLLAYAAVPAP